jgi:hypothetical protein
VKRDEFLRRNRRVQDYQFLFELKLHEVLLLRIEDIVTCLGEEPPKLWLITMKQLASSLRPVAGNRWPGVVDATDE